MNEISFGAVPSPYDARDHSDETLSTTPTADSHFTDISSLLVRMQHKIGKCTGEAMAKASDFILNVDSSDDFIYRGTKERVDVDGMEGSSIRSVLKFAQKYGVCKKDTWDVPVTRDMTYPQYLAYDVPQYAYDEAASRKIGRYFSVPIEVSLLKAAIRKYGVVIARMEVGPEWYTPDWNAANILPLKPPSTVVSGHAIVLYGYSTDATTGKTSFYLANSWSRDWAANGNGYFVYEDYRPTEAWVATLEPIPTPTADNSPVVQDSVWRKLLAILNLR